MKINLTFPIQIINIFFTITVLNRFLIKPVLQLVAKEDEAMASLQQDKQNADEDYAIVVENKKKLLSSVKNSEVYQKVLVLLEKKPEHLEVVGDLGQSPLSLSFDQVLLSESQVQDIVKVTWRDF